MAITMEQCRCRIGTFTQPVKCKVAVPALKLKYILLSIRVMLFFMLLSQSIEANPGPPPTSSANSAPLLTSSVTYSRGGGRVRGTGTGRGGGTGNYNAPHSQSQTTARVIRSSSQNLYRQPS